MFKSTFARITFYAIVVKWLSTRQWMFAHPDGIEEYVSITTIEALGIVGAVEANALRYITDRLDGILKRKGSVATHANPATFHTSEGLLRLGGFKDRQSLEQTLVAHFKAMEPAPKIKVLRISENLVSISIIKP